MTSGPDGSLDEKARATLATYDSVAARFLANTRDRSRGAADLDAFAAAVVGTGTGAAPVLDLGAGPGCDSAELRLRGLEVVAMDLSMAMLRVARDELPGPRVRGDLVRLPFASSRARGVWANACLLHLEPPALRAALSEMARVCRPGAPVHVSIKAGSGGVWETERYGTPRWFQYWEPGAFDTLLTGLGWTIERSRVDETRRDTWIVRLLRPPASGS